MDASLQMTEGGWIKLLSDYDKDFITDLKFRIPWTSRSWHPEGLPKFWLVGLNYRNTLLGLLDEHHYDVDDMTAASAKSSTKQSAPSQDEALLNQLFERTPQGLRRKLYAQLCLVFHPDVGGDHHWMQWLNSTWLKWEG